MRRSVMGAVVAAAVVSSLVTLGVSALVAPRIAEAQGRALVGESLTLVGANGKARVAIGTFTGPGNREVGDFGIELFADDGSRRIAIQTGANSGTAAENPSISLFSRQNVDQSSLFIATSNTGDPYIFFRDTEGTSRVFDTTRP